VHWRSAARGRCPALSLCYQSVERVRASYVLGCMPRRVHVAKTRRAGIRRKRHGTSRLVQHLYLGARVGVKCNLLFTKLASTSRPSSGKGRSSIFYVNDTALSPAYQPLSAFKTCEISDIFKTNVQYAVATIDPAPNANRTNRNPTP